jgi:UDP-2-acetamido-2-deoxy-ribo-hexuluronate aminotransferase
MKMVVSMIPYLDLKPQYQALEKAINSRIQTVLNHGQFILGPEVEECEKALNKFIGSKYCLTAASGTDALMLACMAVGVGPGDEVITTPFSFFATTEVISILGATPVFVDIDAKTFNIDVKQIEAAISPRTKAIMPVSLYGQPADLDEICAIGTKHKIPVIEDAAQSFGAAYKDRKSCGVATISATSFFPAKPLGCYGDGGAVFTNDAALNLKMSQIRSHGQLTRYNHIMIGINGRLDTLQCAVLIEKLKRYDWEIERRNLVAQRYNEAFMGLEGRLTTPKLQSDRGSVWAQYTVMVENRDRFGALLKEKGVPTSVHYPIPLHKQPVYEHLAKKYHLPVVEKIASQVISLPMYADLTDANQLAVIEAVKEVVKTF